MPRGVATVRPTCADPGSFVRGWRNLMEFLLCFLNDEGRYMQDSDTTISGPSSAQHLKTFRWWADAGPSLNTSMVGLWFSRDLDKYF